MRVTLIGHASILVEMEGGTCLMDPIFFDPFEEGAVVSCPRRRVFPEKLPPVDLLVISHRHPDHFDLRSVARLPRTIDVIVPADPQIVYALRRLGFTYIHPVHPMAPILSGTFELYPTRSALSSIQEFGMVFKDRSGTLWNQVDSLLAVEVIDRVVERFGSVDLLLAMYASQNFEYFETRSTEFPYQTHRLNLENALRIAPRWIVPGSAGFRFCGDQAWVNSFLFPISRERFVGDLQRLGYAGNAQIMNPGDVIEIDGAAITYHPRVSDVAVMIEDDTPKIRFDPTTSVPELTDPNPEGRSREELARIIRPCIREGMASYVRAGYGLGDRVIGLYRDHAVRYVLGIVYPDGPPDWFRFEFDDERVHIVHDTEVLPADIVDRIAASPLVGWIAHEKSIFYVRAYYRRYETLYEASAVAGQVHLERQALPDLLMHYVLNAAAGSETAVKQYVDRQVDAIASIPILRA
jgi:UDP-MurNAc hydroxylase